MAVTGGGIAETVSGTHAHPNVSLTLAAYNYTPCTITAQMLDAASIVGTISGSGFIGESLTLRKQ